MINNRQYVWELLLHYVIAVHNDNTAANRLKAHFGVVLPLVTQIAKFVAALDTFRQEKQFQKFVNTD